MQLPSELAFWLFVPGLLLVLLFAWLIFAFRGSRTTRFNLSGLGLSLTIDSSVSTDAKGKDVS